MTVTPCMGMKASNTRNFGCYTVINTAHVCSPVKESPTQLAMSKPYFFKVFLGRDSKEAPVPDVDLTRDKSRSETCP